MREHIEIIEFDKNFFIASQTVKGKTIGNRELHAILSSTTMPVGEDEAKIPDSYPNPVYVAMLTFENCVFTPDALIASADFAVDPLSPLNQRCSLFSIGFQDTALTMTQAEQLIKTRIDSPNSFALSMLHSGIKQALIGGICSLINDVAKRIFATQEHWLINTQGVESDETNELVSLHNALVRSFSHFLLKHSLYMTYHQLDRHTQLTNFTNGLVISNESATQNLIDARKGLFGVKMGDLIDKVGLLQNKLRSTTSSYKDEVKVFLYEISAEIQLYLPAQESMCPPAQIVTFLAKMNLYFSTRFALRTEFTRSEMTSDKIIESVIRVAPSMSVNLRGEMAVGTRTASQEDPLVTLSVVLCNAVVFSFVGNIVKVKPLTDTNKLRQIIYEANKIAFFNDIQKLEVVKLPYIAVHDIGMAILVFFEIYHLSVIAAPDLEEQQSALRALSLLKKILAKDTQFYAAKLVIAKLSGIIKTGQTKLYHINLRSPHSAKLAKLLQGYLQRMNVAAQQIMQVVPGFDTETALLQPASIRTRQLRLIDLYYRCIYINLNTQPMPKKADNNEVEIRKTVAMLQHLLPVPAELQSHYLQALQTSNRCLYEYEVDLYSGIARITNQTFKDHVNNVVMMASGIIDFYKSWLVLDDVRKGQSLEQQHDFTAFKIEQCLYVQKLILFLQGNEYLELDDIIIPSSRGDENFEVIVKDFSIYVADLLIKLNAKLASLTVSIKERDAAKLKAESDARLKAENDAKLKTENAAKALAAKNKSQTQKKNDKPASKKIAAKQTPSPKSSSKLTPVSKTDEVSKLMMHGKYSEAEAIAAKEIASLLTKNNAGEHNVLLATLYYQIADCLYLKTSGKVLSREKKYSAQAFEYLWEGYQCAQICFEDEIDMSDQERRLLSLLIEEVEISQFFAKKQKLQIPVFSQDQAAMSDDSSSASNSSMSISSSSSSATSSTCHSPSLPDVVYRCQFTSTEKSLIDKLTAKYGKENVFIYGSGPTAKLSKLLHGSDTVFESEDIDIVVFHPHPAQAMPELRQDFGLKKCFREETLRGKFLDQQVDITVLNSAEHNIDSFLKKKDVSMKAVALNALGYIVDTSGLGVTAIAQRRVEFMPGFKENKDPIILLNYIRGALYPAFTEEEDKLDHIKKNAEGLSQQPGFVLLDHFRKHFLKGNAVKALRLWRRCGLFAELLPLVDNALYDENTEKRFGLLCQQLDAEYASLNRQRKISIYHLLAEFLKLALGKQALNSIAEDIDGMIMPLRAVSPLIKHLADDEVAKISNRIVGFMEPIHYAQPSNPTLFAHQASSAGGSQHQKTVKACKR